MVRGIRGAITAEDNTEPAIAAATRELLRELVRRNNLDTRDIAAAFFSASPDVTAAFPAAAARSMGWDFVPMMCMQEMAVPGSLPRCIRVLILVNTERGQDEMKHVYLRDAKRLRPDLT